MDSTSFGRAIQVEERCTEGHIEANADQSESHRSTKFGSRVAGAMPAAWGPLRLLKADAGEGVGIRGLELEDRDRLPALRLAILRASPDIP